MRRRTNKSILGGAYGSKAVTLAEFDSFLDWMVSGGEEGGQPADLYRTVSWIFWCVRRRAYAIAQMPYAIYPLGVEDDDPDQEIKDFIDLRRMLWQVEAWLCLEAQAFVLKRLPEKLQVLNKYTCRVLEYDNDGPTMFEQTVSGRKQTFKPEELLYFRTWHPHDDVNEGIPPTDPASVPAQVIRHTNTWAKSFFENGAIPSTILTTEGPTPPDAEIQRIRGAWNKLLQGAKNAFQTIVLGRGLTPTVIGQPVSDLAMPELDVSKRDQILASFDLPPGLPEAKTNRAERDALKLEAYQSCHIPEWETWIEPVLNEQLLNPLGLRISGRPGELEIFQAQELEKAEGMAFAAQTIANYYKENLVTVDEARSWLDALGQAANLPALDETFEPEERTPPQLKPFTGEQPQEEGGGEDEGPVPDVAERIDNRMPKALLDDLDRWERKAVTRIKEGSPLKALEFASDAIPAMLHSMIVHSLEHAVTLGDVLETFKAARGESKQIQFIPEGQGEPLPPVPAEIAVSDADIDRAIKSWDKRMPEFAGLLDATVIHRENYDNA